MGLITIPDTFTGGTTILASEVNANFAAITAVVNGSIDSANLANSAVGQNQLAASAVTDSKIATGAAIALSKLASLTANLALISNSTGAITTSSVTNTELGYLSGVTSAIQAQIDSATADIATNTTDIATNTTDISTNTTDIGTNTTDIATINSSKGTASGIATLDASSRLVQAATVLESAGMVESTLTIPATSTALVPAGIYVWNCSKSVIGVEIYNDGKWQNPVADSNDAASFGTVVSDGVKVRMINVDLTSQIVYLNKF